MRFGVCAVYLPYYHIKPQARITGSLVLWILSHGFQPMASEVAHSVAHE